MSETDFEQLIDGYIKRGAESGDRVPADLFFNLLLTRLAAGTGETVILKVAVANDLVVITPDRELTDVVVRGNEIFIGGHRLVVQMEQSDSHDVPSAS